MVPLAGLEPARVLPQQILNLPRLPIPPQGPQSGAIIVSNEGGSTESYRLLDTGRLPLL